MTALIVCAGVAALASPRRRHRTRSPRCDYTVGFLIRGLGETRRDPTPTRPARPPPSLPIAFPDPPQPSRAAVRPPRNVQRERAIRVNGRATQHPAAIKVWSPCSRSSASAGRPKANSPPSPVRTRSSAISAPTTAAPRRLRVALQLLPLGGRRLDRALAERSRPGARSSGTSASTSCPGPRTSLSPRARQGSEPTAESL